MEFIGVLKKECCQYKMKEKFDWEDNPLWVVKVVKLDERMIKVSAYNRLTGTEKCPRYIKLRLFDVLIGKTLAEKVEREADRMNTLCILLNLLTGNPGDGLILTPNKKRKKRK